MTKKCSVCSQKIKNGFIRCQKCRQKTCNKCYIKTISGKYLCKNCYTDRKKPLDEVMKATSYMIIFMFLFLFSINSVLATNYYIASDRGVVLSNFSPSMNQGFYYQRFQQGVGYTNTSHYWNGNSGNDSEWSTSGGGVDQVNDRNDFDIYTNNIWIYFSPHTVGYRTVIRFAPQSGDTLNVSINASYHTYSGSTDGTEELITRINSTGTYIVDNTTVNANTYAMNNTLITLLPYESIGFEISPKSADNGDSAGILFNLTTINASASGGNPTPTINMTVNSPQNTTYISNNVSINVTVQAQNLSRIWYYNGVATNVSYTNYTTIILSNGVYNYTFYANDTQGLNATPMKIVFTVNYTAPLSVANGSSTGFMYDGNHSGVYPFVFPNNFTSYNKFNCGNEMRSTPLIFNNSVFFMCNDGYLYKNNVSNVSQNQQKLNLNYNGNGEMSQPVIYNNTLIISTDNGTILNINPSNISNILWSFNDTGFFQSTPTVLNGYLYTGESGAHPGLLKNYVNNGSLVKFISETDNCFASPLVDAMSGYGFFACDSGYVYQVNLSSFIVINSYLTGAVMADSASFSSDALRQYIFIGSNNWYIYQLNASNITTLINKYLTSNDVEGTTANKVPYAYTATGDKRLLQSDSANISNVLNSYTLSGGAWSSPIIDQNNAICLGDTTGLVYLFNASNVSQKLASKNVSNGASGYTKNDNQFWDLESCIPYNDSNGYYAFIGSINGTMYQFYNVSGASNATNTSDYPTAPIFTAPINQTYTLGTNNTYIFFTWNNVTDASNNMKNFSLYLTASLIYNGWQNYTNQSFNKTSGYNGIYFINVTAKDSNNNENSTYQNTYIDFCINNYVATWSNCNINNQTTLTGWTDSNVCPQSLEVPPSGNVTSCIYVPGASGLTFDLKTSLWIIFIIILALILTAFTVFTPAALLACFLTISFGIYYYTSGVSTDSFKWFISLSCLMLGIVFLIMFIVLLFTKGVFPGKQS